MKYLTLFLLLVACTTPEQQANNFGKLFSGNMKIVDLTYTVDTLMPYWPNERKSNPLVYEAIASHPSGLPIIGKYSTPEHNGTHLDAPIHFADNLPTVDEIPAENFFAPLAIIDVSEKCASDSDYGLSEQDILDWEERNGLIPERAVVIMSTGWGKKSRDMDAYQNMDENGVMHFPGFTVESNSFLVNDRNIVGIGIDNLSVDPGFALDFPAHKVTNGAGKYHLENVANVHLLPEIGAYLVVAPIKLSKGSGGQVRLFAIVPE